MNTLETKENYLETILIISLDKKSVKAIDVAKYLGFSRPTVSVALKNLEDEGYISIVDNNLKLTALGNKIAKKTYEKHEYIAKLLMKLGVPKKTAYSDSCMLEHDLSEESFKAIKKATKDYI